MTSVEVAAQIKTAKDVPEGHLKRLEVRLPAAGESAELVRRPGRHESFYARAGKRREGYDPPRQPWSNPALALSNVLYTEQEGKKIPPLPNLLRGTALQRIATSIQRVSSGRNPPQRSYSRDGGSAGDRAR